MDQKFQEGPEYPAMMDNNDILGHFRHKFYIKKGTIYMCGNSLGLCTRAAEESVLKAIQCWKEQGVKMWNVENNKYFLYAKNLAQLMAPLINADPEEVALGGCTTANIHQAISTFYKPSPYKYKILVDNLNFPTDRYAVDSQVRLKGYEPKDAVKVVKGREGKYIYEEDIIRAMSRDVAIVFLPAVLYRSGQLIDMARISRVAKERDIIIGWDLCHAIGAVEIDFKAIDPDFAIWCTYKYLNGGPGSNAGMFLNRKHFDLLPGMAGWFGNKVETQFLLRQEFDHEKSASGWQLGTPTIFSMAPLEGSLKILEEAGISNIRKKSLHITAYLMFLIETRLGEYGFVIGNLKDNTRRSGHVSVEHTEAYRICIALKDRGIIPDFREPNVIRLTPTALYTSYEEVYTLVNILTDIVKNESYKEYTEKKALVV